MNGENPTDPCEQIFRQLAAEIPQAQRAGLLGATVGARRHRRERQRFLTELAPPFGSVSSAALNQRLASYPTVDRLLGRCFHHACVDGRISEEYLPRDWHKTEVDLRRLVEGVQGFAAHWDQNHDPSASTLTALLAEVEAFTWLM